MEVRTQPTYGNCLFGAWYVSARGRARRILFVSSHAWWVPAHLVVETRSGNYLHFRYTSPQCPLWYMGEFLGIRGSRAMAALRRENRRILLTMPWLPFMLLSSVLVAFLVIPWIITWTVWPIAEAIKSLVGLVRRGIHSVDR